MTKKWNGEWWKKILQTYGKLVVARNRLTELFIMKNIQFIDYSNGIARIEQLFPEIDPIDSLSIFFRTCWFSIKYSLL